MKGLPTCLGKRGEREMKIAWRAKKETYLVVTYAFNFEIGCVLYFAWSCLLWYLEFADSLTY